MSIRPKWTVPPQDAAYYAIASPASLQYSFPLLFPTFGSIDRTYGRSKLPRSPLEVSLRQDGRFTVVDRVVQLGGGESISYAIWEMNASSTSNGTDGATDRAKSKEPTDIVWCHGINDYGAKFLEHCLPLFLELPNHRIIIPDLPGHGRSTGIHVHLPRLEVLGEGVWEVLKDVLKGDLSLAGGREAEGKSEGASGNVDVSRGAVGAGGVRRRTFVAGQSLGGFVAVDVCMRFGGSTDLSLPLIAGGIFLCPMLSISAETRPAYIFEIIAKTLSYIAGFLPLIHATKGRNSEDPNCEIQFEHDPNTYHGKLRVATGLGILTAITDLDKKMSSLKIPFTLHHGTGDRVTSYKGSEKLFKEASSVDKEIKLYDGYEHILLRKGHDEADDERRQVVMSDILDWLARR